VINFFSNACSQLRPLRLIACISKEIGRKLKVDRATFSTEWKSAFNARLLYAWERPLLRLCHDSCYNFLPMLVFLHA
jgi:hypothetical protein